MRDLLTDDSFRARPRRVREGNRESIALRRLSRSFAEQPDSVLQELVNTAVEFCGADGAGISLEEPERRSFRWVVVAGSLSRYLDDRASRHVSPLGSLIESSRPQLFRVSKPEIDHLGVMGRPVTDGVLIPWATTALKGTLWAVSHTSETAFDEEDYALLSSLADFASIIVRYQHHQRLLHESGKAIAVAEMAHRLAHRINNPLQSLTNTLFLARSDAANAPKYLEQAEADLARLSAQVATLLEVSTAAARPKVAASDLLATDV
ncbi:hypothetical protein SAMN05421819_0525 [Bryocella elongata]|uniref:histidine kinase n=1 Tax=Bryocella elongata TaxID=863522 RepID=A0A1H5T935_9BACT|nr:GAF domain-containing protein [Bryocella elongata]SEF59382.1 hypothetical protein SAMN05421819_0525 [Bryocella elongata]